MDNIPVNYVVYDDNGLILQIGTCPLSAMTLQASPGRNVLQGEGHYDVDYVLNNQIVAYTDAELQAKNSLSKGFIWKMPERVVIDNRTLDDAKNQAWDRIKTARGVAENTPFVYNGVLYDYDLVHIPPAVTLAQLIGPTFTEDWTTHDNVTITLNQQDMIGLGLAMGQATSAIYETARTLRLAIDACTTNAEADVIAWPIN